MTEGQINGIMVASALFALAAILTIFKAFAVITAIISIKLGVVGMYSLAKRH